MRGIRDAGWIAFSLLLVAICCLGWEKIERRIPFTISIDLKQRLDAKKELLSTTAWSDERPLCLFLGDSQIELGMWYELFKGRHAVINAGVSMARVEDVASVIAQGSASPIDTVVVMCGINDLGRREKPEKVIQDYRGLLDSIMAKICPRRVIVLSVMPVSVTASGHSQAIALNASVKELNAMLASMVVSSGAEYVDLTPAVCQGDGMNQRLTNDGLHPNNKGYKIISAVLGEVLEAASHLSSKSSNP